MSVQAAAWLGLAAADLFGLAALPYCSFSTRRHAASRLAGVRIGDRVLDLTTASGRLLPGRDVLFRDGTLDAFLAAGDKAWADVRAEITGWLSQDHFREAVEDLRRELHTEIARISDDHGAEFEELRQRIDALERPRQGRVR